MKELEQLMDHALAEHAPAGLGAPPMRATAVLTCMDARVDAARLLGLQPGEAHVIRNAGAVASGDVLRSLAMSQRLLGTERVIVVGHTQCGFQANPDVRFRAQVAQETGADPGWEAVPTTGDPDEDVRQAVRTIRAAPFLPHRDRVGGLVLDVATGTVRRVEA